MHLVPTDCLYKPCTCSTTTTTTIPPFFVWHCHLHSNSKPNLIFPALFLKQHDVCNWVQQQLLLLWCQTLVLEDDMLITMAMHSHNLFNHIQFYAIFPHPIQCSSKTWGWLYLRSLMMMTTRLSLQKLIGTEVFTPSLSATIPSWYQLVEN